MKDTFTKSVVSISAVLVILWLGIVVFFVNPINLRTDMYWLNWPLLLSNGVIVAGVLLGWWLTLRRIWGLPKQERSAEKGRGVSR
jgi:hypothetical protein